ncbi:hypothetical protein L6255_02155 [Candidatus Parcubacteria bacterium]|nr:hypothetical protein [Candidatus Parcubacteria bacterium]
MNFKRKTSGQATLVIVLIVMVTSLGIGVAAANRAVSNIRRTTYSQQADQAYNCARAGAEDGVSKVYAGTVGTLPYTNPAVTLKDQAEAVDVCSYNYTIRSVLEYESSMCTYSLDSVIPQDDVFEVNLESYNGGFQFHWQTGAGLEVTLIKGSSSPFDVEKSAYSCGTSRSGFTPGSSSTLTGYSCYGNINLSGSYKIARIRPLFADTKIKVGFVSGSCSGIPEQGYKILSTGKAVDAIRKLQVKVSRPQMSAIFDYAIFSGGNISK